MKPQNKAIEGQEVTIFQEIFYKYLPYWYVFLFLLIASFIMAYFYLTTTSPLYEAHASILVKDQKRGQEESKMEDAFNVFSQKNILENEIEIIRSNALLNEVISRLHLNLELYGYATKSCRMDMACITRYDSTFLYIFGGGCIAFFS